MDSQVQPLPLGCRIDGLEVTQVTGADPAGYDYLATDTTSKKVVAVREYAPAPLVLRGEDRRILLRDEQHRAGFDAGLKAIFALAPLAKARHPGLYALLRIIETNGTAYAVWEPVAGELLSALIEREKAFDEPRLKSILLPLADGLEAAHETGVLHLGIRPETILIRPNGAPVLVGFGGTSAPSPASVARGYRALERHSTELRVGRWTDIYSLGAVGYRLVVGQPPPDAAARALSDTMKPAQEVGANKYHRSLLHAIDWALTIHPLERPQNLAQWKDALLGLSEPTGRGAAGAGATVPITATMVRKFSEMRSGTTKAPVAPAAAPPAGRPISAAATPIPPQWLEPPKPAPAPPEPPVPKPAAPPAPPPAPPSATIPDPAPAARPAPSPAIGSPVQPRSRAPWIFAGAVIAILAVATAIWLMPGDDATVPPEPAITNAPEPPVVPASVSEAPTPPPTVEPPPVVAVAPPPAASPAAGTEPPPAAAPPSEVVLRSRKSRVRRTGEFREMQQQLTTALLPRLKGQWSMESTVSESLKNGTCPASVTRIWVMTFTGAANDGQEIAGRFKSSFAAEGGDACKSLRQLNNAIGELIAEPASPTAIRLAASTTTCSGDCAPSGTLEYFVPDASYRLSISERGDRLTYEENGRRFVLTRAKTTR